MLNQAVKEKIDLYLGDVIEAARESLGLCIEDASVLTGFTQPEYMAIETFPSTMPLSTLSQVMTKFGAQFELMDATNTVSAMVHLNQLDKLVYRRPPTSHSPWNRPPTEHPPAY